MGIASKAFAINSHQVSVGVIIDHRLIAAAILGRPQKQSAIGSEIIFHFQPHFKVSIFFIGKNDSSVPRNILTPLDRSILDHPLSTTFFSTCCTVTTFSRDMPAFEIFPTKNCFKSVGIECQYGHRHQKHNCRSTQKLNHFRERTLS